MRTLLLIVPALLFATGCPAGAASPFGPAKTTLSLVSEGLKASDGLVQTYIDVWEADCLRVGPTKSDQYITCMKLANVLKKYWPKVSEVALQSIKAAQAGIKEAEQKLLHNKECEKSYPDKNSQPYKDCVAKHKVAVMALVRTAVCTVLTALVFLPDSLQAKLKLYIDLAKSYFCSGTSK